MTANRQCQLYDKKGSHVLSGHHAWQAVRASIKSHHSRERGGAVPLCLPRLGRALADLLHHRKTVAAVPPVPPVALAVAARAAGLLHPVASNTAPLCCHTPPLCQSQRRIWQRCAVGTNASLQPNTPGLRFSPPMLPMLAAWFPVSRAIKFPACAAPRCSCAAAIPTRPLACSAC